MYPAATMVILSINTTLMDGLLLVPSVSATVLHYLGSHPPCPPSPDPCGPDDLSDGAGNHCDLSGNPVTRMDSRVIPVTSQVTPGLGDLSDDLSDFSMIPVTCQVTQWWWRAARSPGSRTRRRRCVTSPCASAGAA